MPRAWSAKEMHACLLSLTRQPPNQLLKALQADGVVRLHVGEIELVDVDALRRASGLGDGAY